MILHNLILIFAFILFFAAAIFVLYQFYSFIRCGCGKYGPFVSSYGKLKEDILNEARLILKKSKSPLKVTDLGCGSGALLLPLAKEFPKHEFIGLEWDIVPLTMGKIKARLAGLKNIRFVKGDYMKESHADMDLIMCYVLKVTGEPLGKKLSKEIKDSCVVISEMFPLKHLEEIKQVQSSLWGVSEKYFVYKKAITDKTVSRTPKSTVKKNPAQKMDKTSVKPQKSKPLAKKTNNRTVAKSAKA